MQKEVITLSEEISPARTKQLMPSKVLFVGKKT